VPPAIPPDPVREEPLPPDHGLHEPRDRVERLDGELERSRAVAARHGRTAESRLALVQLAAPRLWMPFVHTA
jgi:hypothetical protein